MASLSPLTGTLGHERAMHLLRRATYDLSKSRIDSTATQSIATAVDNLFTTPAPTMAEPIDHQTGQPWINSGVPRVSGDWYCKQYVKSWFINESLHDTSITTKMMMFLHQTFAVDSDPADNEHLFDYLSLIRFYATGSYKSLALKMVTDNLMSSYLDNRWNHRWNPNENFAREFFELFTIGKGPQIGPGNYTNYTETDIQEAAKLLTGFRFGDRANVAHADPDTGITRNYTELNPHDQNSKTFTAAFNNTTIAGATSTTAMWTELQEFVDMIFVQDETARNICRKLYRFFVSRNITTEIENDIIIPLAAILKNNDYDLEITMKTLLKSEHFYDEDDSTNADEIVGGLMKAPIDIVLPLMNYFQISPPDVNTNTYQHYLNFYQWSMMDVMFEMSGFDILHPDSVAGYGAYYQEPFYQRNWFNTATLISRYKIGDMFLQGHSLLSWSSLGGVQLDIVDFIENGGAISVPADADTLVSELLSYVFAIYPDTDRYDYYLNDVFLDGVPAFDWTEDWNDYLTSGNPNTVKIPLERLFKTIVYSAEYQLM